MANWFSEQRSSKALRRIRLASAALLLGGLCLAQPKADAGRSESGKVTAVRFWSLGDVTRIAIEVSSEFTVKSSRLTDPERLFFDIHGARPELARKGLHTIAVGDGMVAQIRVAETQPEVTRVVLDLLQAAVVTTSQLSNPNRLMIELRSKDKPLPPTAPSVTGGQSLISPPVFVARQEPVVIPAAISGDGSALTRIQIPASPPPPVAAKTVLPSPVVVALPPPTAVLLPGPEPSAAKRGDRSLTRALGLKLGRVVLDAGHGGHDVGTHGPSGYVEKDLTLDVTQRLGALIEDRLGSEVVYTRSEDTYVGLEERTRIANDRKADLFLSVHANSSPYVSAAGVETYILNFTTSKTALELAARENASATSSIHELHDLLDKIALKDKIDESREFASRLQTSLSVLSKRSNDGAKNRGVKKAPFVVLIGAAMPSVLAEIGFLTNPSEEALLLKPEYRQKIAEALYKGVAAYAETLSSLKLARRN